MTNPKNIVQKTLKSNIFKNTKALGKIRKSLVNFFMKYMYLYIKWISFLM